MLKNPLFLGETNLKEEYLLDKIKTVTESDLCDFKTRLIVCKIQNNNEIYALKLEKFNINSYFSERGVDNKVKIGVLVEDEIESVSDYQPAKAIGYTYTYHYFNAPCIFAGVIGELIIQMPIEIKLSPDSFYLTYELCGFAGDLHCVCITFYCIL
jgi:hypothetical protein